MRHCVIFKLFGIQYLKELSNYGLILLLLPAPNSNCITFIMKIKNLKNYLNEPSASK